MKKLVILFCVFLTSIVFSQESKANNEKNSFDSKQTSKANAKAYFIEGKEVDYKTYLKIDVQLVDKLEVIKNDPKYPNGKVNVILKK